LINRFTRGAVRCASLLTGCDLALDLVFAGRADFGLAPSLLCKRGQVFEHGRG
jgi:hypothetical protein